MRFTIKPISDYYAEHDPRRASEAFELEQAIGRELPDALEARSTPGEKGLVTDVIVPLATGGVIAGLVEVFKAWLATRPVDRRIELEYEIDGGSRGTLVITASNVDSDQLAAITREAMNARG